VACSLLAPLSAGEVAITGLSFMAMLVMLYSQEGEAVEHQWPDSGRQSVVLPSQKCVA
jgi:hypothetical protein